MSSGLSARLLRLARACLGLVVLNFLLFALYRFIFVAWFARASAEELLAVVVLGLRLDGAVLGLELVALGALALVTRYARGSILIGALWTLTYANLLILSINLFFFHERNQHLWEMFFANLARPRDIWVAFAPFFYQHPLLMLGVLLISAGIFALALRHARAWSGHRYDLWRSARTAGLALAAVFLPTLAMLHPVIVKREAGRSNTEIAVLASRHQMLFDDYVLNQAVVNPLWDLVHEYVPAALARSRVPYRLPAADALHTTQRLLGVPDGERPYPLLRMVRGRAGLGVRNIVMIQVEGLGTTVLERDGPGGPVTPFLRTLAAEGLYLPNIYQSFPSTDGAVFATLTSLHWTHALGGRGERLSESVVGGYFGSLPRLLLDGERRHYAFSGFRHRTAEFVSFVRNQGYQTVGFDSLQARLGPRADHEVGPLGVHDGPLLREAATTLIASPAPFTAYVMTASSHSPWQVPAGAPAPLGDTPLGTFRYADDCIRTFVDQLRAGRPDFDDTLLVVTGDHTSAAFGRDLLERIRVPLILAGPPVSRAHRQWPRRLDTVASQVDVLPTILSLVDSERPYSGMGQSLLEPRTATAGIISGDSRESLYFKDGFALRYQLRHGRGELLALKGGDLGVVDLSAEHPDVAGRLTHEFLALYETADRLMRDKRVFPRDGLSTTSLLVTSGRSPSNDP
jgi:hypothetical protein